MTALTGVMEDQAAETMTDLLETAPVQEQSHAGEIERIINGIRERVGEERFDLWFDRKTRIAISGESLVVEAGNAFAAKWIGGKFREELLAEAQAAIGPDAQVIVRVAEDLRAEAAAGSRAGIAAQAESPRHGDWAHGANARTTGSGNAGRGGSPAGAGGGAIGGAGGGAISARHTLEEFVPGPSNELAYRAACRVAEFPAQQFNPLFIHGHCGLGKTHLLQGICHRFTQQHPGKNWLYLTGEQFTNEFLEAIAQRRTNPLRRRIRNADLLVIDDVHFLANKKATQEEFLHTFNQVDASGKQIVLASDCAPRQILNLSEQLSSRFVSGMVLRVDSPDLPTRLEILRRRSAKNSWNLTDTVLMHIARSATSSVRELEGMLLQVIAGISLIGRQGAEAEAGQIMASIRERTAMRGPVPVEKIVTAAAEHFAVSSEAIMGHGREKIISIARAAAMHLARQHSGMSFPEIGRAFGGKNHSTVIAACQRIEALISGGRLLCWNTPAGPRHQAVSDALHDLESAIRRNA